ncbi:GNAT family N-acetyltransferase [Streptomyces violaceusniger]|uniref:GCN5-related N-acetyltransferase n=1 Tax=Streptomyces violaceusniger (strain Tu 4113) TaxID=653045 RepID=G2PE74_STRV4|nr:GNAT family N-acetyltransferase [Streptomyces violaceusniger]AEM83050.1 GCN5-related N-acetyltransferase [Streptomyces violaceusniger Tu 4113]
MAAHETVKSPEFAQFSRPQEITPALRRELIDCWTAVSNAGGAVLAGGFPLPPVSTRDVGPVVDQIVHGLDPRRGRLLVAAVEGVLAGWLILRRDPHPLVTHCGVVNHVQTHTRFRGLGIGAALMRRVPGIARDEMGLERLGLAARAGLGLEEFYAKLGWAEIGRWPGALRVAPGDDRDEILMSLAL